MISDKLSTKSEFVKKREKLGTEMQRFIADKCKGRTAGYTASFASELYELLDLHAEVAQAPILYTLQSAAEVGFAQASVTPFLEPDAVKEPE